MELMTWHMWTWQCTGMWNQVNVCFYSKLKPPQRKTSLKKTWPITVKVAGFSELQSAWLPNSPDSAPHWAQLTDICIYAKKPGTQPRWWTGDQESAALIFNQKITRTQRSDELILIRITMTKTKCFDHSNSKSFQGAFSPFIKRKKKNEEK